MSIGYQTQNSPMRPACIMVEVFYVNMTPMSYNFAIVNDRICNYGPSGRAMLLWSMLGTMFGNGFIQNLSALFLYGLRKETCGNYRIVPLLRSACDQRRYHAL